MESFNLLGHVMAGSFFSLAVLSILLFMSVLSWGVGLAKIGSLLGMKNKNSRFYKRLDPLSIQKIKESISTKKKDSAFQNILIALAGDYTRMVGDSAKGVSLGKADLVDALERRLFTMNSNLAGKMESGLGILASISNTAPFIGLLGTVLGITFSFQEIGLKGNANLAVVAPGISEALIATAFGLFAAIPSTLFYNFSRAQIKSFINTQTNFGQDVITLLVYKSK